MDSIGIVIGLVVAGMVLFGLEILTPTFGVLAGLAVGALVGSVWVCYTRISPVGAIVLFVALVVIMPVYLAMLVKLLPKTPLGKRLFLRKAKQPGTGVPEAAEHEALVGHTGTAETLLRPTGAVRIDGQRVIASAESGLIDKGATVKIVRAEGMTVIVREVEPSS